MSELSSYDPVHQAITDFVHLTTSGSNTVVSVDTDGTATGHSFVNVATLTGVTGALIPM
ncbi:type I secretion C-terminal target domain-containing protein [Caballeronia sp. GAWG1-1]|uniref:type I secretion C-terminal target domain-containing protein n=1 Tax=Caballeronia sp. GAWG1-1 TaxID=2921742 RepID=UPI0032F04272